MNAAFLRALGDFLAKAGFFEASECGFDGFARAAGFELRLGFLDFRLRPLDIDVLSLLGHLGQERDARRGDVRKTPHNRKVVDFFADPVPQLPDPE